MSDPTPLASVPIETSAAAKASFERCCTHGDFFICFYRNFFKNCPEVEPMFQRTDFDRQHKLLRGLCARCFRPSRSTIRSSALTSKPLGATPSRPASLTCRSITSVHSTRRGLASVGS